MFEKDKFSTKFIKFAKFREIFVKNLGDFGLFWRCYANSRNDDLGSPLLADCFGVFEKRLAMTS